MVTDKNNEPIKWDIYHLISFVFVWGMSYLLITLLNFWIFLIFGIDLKIMWISNLTTSLPIALILFYLMLKGQGEDYDSWGN